MATSFAADIQPLFTDHDDQCMTPRNVRLRDYAYMSDPAAGGVFQDHANARDVYARLTGARRPRMPMGGPYWPQQDLDLYKRWMDEGFQP